MNSLQPLPPYHRIRAVGSFAELAAARLADGVNALCWERTLAGDFAEVVRALAAARHDEEAIDVVDEDRLKALALSARGKEAVAVILQDLRWLREQERDPVLNCIYGYPRDEEAGPVVTDVFSWHADSAPVEADTWLCTYHGSPSEGLRNEETRRKVDDAVIRAELLRTYGGADDEGFQEFLHEHCYDLHYAPKPGAQPYSFGIRNLWRIAVDWPGSPVPPCVHRAPATIAGEPRLMVIC
ncbi:hypothetical protein Verru16b_02551 [Lacunisphaera limnophila]|uniref:DUF1826 domain-containing protein n=1 Tax=Lacunisphaera limnophila TaxID=1838286 RepID=A0A1D8AX71_9BACT|nr:hypothetical protein [Lacunisphaera limnophila]AOS45470.1 hypothetical protein Verru16b_02551 [Lacunisphaera limnophila]